MCSCCTQRRAVSGWQCLSRPFRPLSGSGHMNGSGGPTAPGMHSASQRCSRRLLRSPPVVQTAEIRRPSAHPATGCRRAPAWCTSLSRRRRGGTTSDLRERRYCSSGRKRTWDGGVPLGAARRARSSRWTPRGRLPRHGTPIGWTRDGGDEPQRKRRQCSQDSASPNRSGVSPKPRISPARGACVIVSMFGLFRVINAVFARALSCWGRAQAQCITSCCTIW
jgi:hypothetical protein